MRREFMILMLALYCASPRAEWVKAETHVSDFHLYADTSMIDVLSGNRIRMWDLKDYTIAQEISGARYSSEKTLREYDCVEGRYRDYAWTWFSGNMGEGEVVVLYINNGIEGDWHNLKPPDRYYSLLGMACAYHDR